MRITASCECQATFEVDDSYNKWADPDRSLNSDGRRYIVEIIFDRWRQEHPGCRIEREDED